MKKSVKRIFFTATIAQRESLARGDLTNVHIMVFNEWLPATIRRCLVTASISSGPFRDFDFVGTVDYRDTVFFDRFECR